MKETSTPRNLNSPWMTQEEAAEYARVSVSTIDRWRRECSLEFSQPTGGVLIHRDKLDMFLQRHEARKILRRHRVSA